MRVSVGPTPSGHVPSGEQAGKAPADGGDQPAFDRVLRQAKGGSRTHASSQPQKPETGETGARQPRWPVFASAHRHGDDAGKLSDDGPTVDEPGAKRDKDARPHPEMQDRLPFLAALHELQRMPTPAGSDDPALTGADGEAEAQDHAALAARGAKDKPSAPALGNAVAVLGKAVPALGDGSGNPQAAPDRLSPDKILSANASPQPDLVQGDDPGTAAQQPSSTIAQKPKAESGAQGYTTTHPQQDDRQSAQAKRVTVIGEQNFPAPAAHPASQTATSLANAIATDNGARHAVFAPAVPTQPNAAGAFATHTLKIELHPAELGMVTASLRLAGGQLSIELKPENHEAHRRLSSDTDTIVRSLRDMGFDVDKVTVLQPSIAVNGPARADSAGMAANLSGRDTSSFQPGNSSGNGAAPGGQQSGRNQGNDGQHSGTGGTAHPRENADGGLFI